MLIAQITDFHIVSAGQLMHDRVDTAAMLAAAVSHINAMSPAPDVVLATGDLVNNRQPSEYEALGQILADLTIPLLPIPGNHDDRTLFRAAFPNAVPAGTAEDRVDYVVDDWELKLVGLDTTIPGEDGGQVTAEQISWLDEQLARAPDKPTLLFQHHPPFLTGIAWMDAVGLAGRELEAELLARHPQVCGVLCGHIHRNIHATVGGVRVSTSPSTGAQVALALDDRQYQYVDELGAVAVHLWTSLDGLVSHISRVGLPEPWLPAWGKEELARKNM